MNRIPSLTAAVVATFAVAPVAVASPPPFQSVEVVRRVSPQLPAQVAVSAPADLAPDDAHLVLQVKSAEGNHVAVTKLDGTGYACVTCGVVPAAFKPTVSADGRKLFFADNKGDNTQQGNPFSGGTGDFNWSILECAPSVYDCRTRAVLPVRFPIAGLGQGAQNREAKFDPLAQYVSWNEVRSLDGTRVTIARLRRDGDHYTLVEPRVLNPSGARGLAGAVDAGRFYEGANFADGGRTLTYQTTSTGLNYDSWRIDLQTGRREQLSGELDYNEISRYSPDGGTVFYSSARGLDRMTVFTQLVRPSLIDMATFGAIGRIGLHGNRGCMQGGWLAARDVPQTPGGYAGQPLLLDGDNRNVRDWEWFADGRRALISLQPFTKAKTAKDTPAALYIVRLPGLRPRPALPTRSLDDFPWRRWTVPSDSYRDMFSTSGRIVVPGPRGGTVTLDRAGFFAAGAWSVTYDGFSSDGRTFIDGTESFTTAVPTLVSRYTVDLREHGAHTGSMKGDLTVGAQTSFRGQMTSTVDGRTLRGIPQEDSCPGARQPVLRITGRPGAAHGRTRALHVSVTATAPGGDTRHPVAGAVVRVDGHAADGLRLRSRTDRDGRATLIVPAERRWRAHAAAGTFRGAARTLRG